MLKTCKLESLIEIQAIEMISVFIAGLAHDLRHPGFNNIYCINS
jgi:hypothetical protein